MSCTLERGIELEKFFNGLDKWEIYGRGLKVRLTKELNKFLNQKKNNCLTQDTCFKTHNLFLSFEPSASLVAQMVKYLPAKLETQVRSLGQEDMLEKEMATHSSTLAWKIPWTEEPGKLPSMGSQSLTWLNNFTVCWTKSFISFPVNCSKRKTLQGKLLHAQNIFTSYIFWSKVVVGLNES